MDTDDTIEVPEVDNRFRMIDIPIPQTSSKYDERKPPDPVRDPRIGRSHSTQAGKWSPRSTYGEEMTPGTVVERRVGRTYPSPCDTPSPQSAFGCGSTADTDPERGAFEQRSPPTPGNVDLMTKPKKRKNYCPFCKRLLSNYSRHLVSQHPDEEEVRTYIALGEYSPRKRKQLRAVLTDKIRHVGNKIYNEEIVDGRRNDAFIPARRPSKRGNTVNNVSYVTCKHCLGFFKKELFFKHLLNCAELFINGEPEAGYDVSPRRKRVRLALSRHAEQLVKENDDASQILKDEVFSKMQMDEITLTVRNDSLICKFGSEFRKNRRGLKQIGYCSSQMRSLARIYLEMKGERPDSIRQFGDCIAPKHFDLLVRAARRLCRYDESSGITNTPSVAPRLCSSLKKCANIIKSDAIKSETMNREEITEVVYRINNFLYLMEKDWGTQVGASSEMSRRRKKVVKGDLLPDPDDIRKFSEFIDSLCPRYMAELGVAPTVRNYERLAKLIIAHIITLNRRRPNETVEITIEEYRSTLDKRVDYGEDSENVVTAEEIESGRNLVIFYVAANKNLKKVPVLLTKLFHSALEVLLASREKVGVRSKYIFGRPGNNELFDGSAVMREIARKANIKSTAMFTANALRHHAATTSQLQSRDDTYTKRLSKFMGHDLQTHEHFYEMPLPLVQKCKVGHKLLQMIQPKRGTVPTTTCTVTSAVDAACTNTTCSIAVDVTERSESAAFSMCLKSPQLRLEEPRRSSTLTDSPPIRIEGITPLTGEGSGEPAWNSKSRRRAYLSLLPKKASVLRCEEIRLDAKQEAARSSRTNRNTQFCEVNVSETPFVSEERARPDTSRPIILEAERDSTLRHRLDPSTNQTRETVEVTTEGVEDESQKKKKRRCPPTTQSRSSLVEGGKRPPATPGTEASISMSPGGRQVPNSSSGVSPLTSRTPSRAITVHSPDTSLCRSTVLDLETCVTSPSSTPRSQVDGANWVPSNDERTSDSTSNGVESCTPPRKTIQRRRWTTAEKNAVYETFGHQFTMNMKPARAEIQSMWEQESALKDRTLQQVVTYVNNIVNNKHHIPTPTRKKIRRMVSEGKKHLSP